MKDEKVFVIGFQKTGTTSLEIALEALGYKVYGGDKNLLRFEKSERRIGTGGYLFAIQYPRRILQRGIRGAGYGKTVYC